VRSVRVSVAAVAMLLGMGISVAKAGTLLCEKGLCLDLHRTTFTYNDYISWHSLKVNHRVSNGTQVNSADRLITTTVTFASGYPGYAFVECPAKGCKKVGWDGNFSPGQELLASYRMGTNKGDGAITLTFSQPVEGAGFQIQPNLFGSFDAKVEAFNGSTPLGTFLDPWGESNQKEDGSAIFLGLQDLNGADITSLEILADKCQYGDCLGFAINNVLLETGPGSHPSVPEPSSLFLLGTGLSASALLFRKLSRRS
jgi:PEP-CTERM motif